MKTDVNYLLSKIGKQTFVNYFNAFGDSSISNQTVIAVLQNDKSFKDHACASKVTNARRIFREGLEQQALSIIAESKRKDMADAAIEAASLLIVEQRKS
jgi:hypothetical protein